MAESDYSRPIVIYGVGAMARVVYSFVRRTRDVVGFTVDDELVARDKESFCGLPLHAFSIVDLTCPPDTADMLFAVGYRDMNALRLDRAQAAKARGYRIASYVDPSVIRHDGTVFGAGCVILDQVSIHAGSRIGQLSFVASQVNIGHDCQIGDGAWINGGVSMGGGCKVGRQSVFGVNASLAHDVTLGDRVFIGAQALVNRDVKDDGVITAPAGEPFRAKSADFLKFSGMQD